MRGPSAGTAAWLSRYGAPLALLLLILFNMAVSPNFVTWQTLYINLTQVATIVIVAIGMTLVIGSGGIDLSVGSLMAIAAALAPLIFLDRIVDLSEHLYRRRRRLRRAGAGRRAPSAISTAGSSPATTSSRSSRR